jgi:3-isopropylmalate dehydratase small subunit
MPTVVLKVGDDVSTDVIYPGRYMATVLPAETPQFAFADDAAFNNKLRAKQIPPGGVIVGGKNFGCGSSREQAASCLKGCDLVVVARSFARIFLQNAINLGLRILVCPEIEAAAGDELEFTESAIVNQTTGQTFRVESLPKSRQAVVDAGGLVPYTRQRLRETFANNVRLVLIATALGLGQLPRLHAQTQLGAGLLNDWLREQASAFTNWDLGGQFRARFEHREHFAILGQPGSLDFRETGADTDNTYVLLREKVHLGYTPLPWFTAFVEARDSSSQSDDRHANPEADSLDLHQGYVALGNLQDFPLRAKIGRQELIYGDERLVGASDWNNIGRVFDAAKLRYRNDQLWVDGFLGRVIIPNDNHFNVANDYDWFYGVYASTKTLCPKQVTDFYFLGRNASRESPQAIGSGLPTFQQGATPRDIYTFGMRFKSLPGTLGGWDYDGEWAGQFGDFVASATAPRLDHEGFAAHAAGGYTWKDVWCSPRLGLEYNYASGDSNPNDNKPFWLADTSDYFYQVNGAPRTGTAANSGMGYGINPG